VEKPRLKYTVKSNKRYVLAVQSTYQEVQVALFQENRQVEKKNIEKTDSSADLIPVLNQMLFSSNITLNDLSFIAVNKGPAPFTTLRVVIASMNGIAFATSIPVVGINGIKALLMEADENHRVPTIVLLDAFSNDVYYGFRDAEGSIKTGCMPVFTFLQEMKVLFEDKMVKFVGNGVIVHKELIESEFGSQAMIVDTFSTCSIDSIARIGIEKWNKKCDVCKQVFPLYLKKQWWHEQLIKQ